jgi:hypothetical protein
MPLDPNTELKTPEKKDWPVVPEDVYQVQITDLTAEVSEWKGEKKDVFKFEFTIIEDGPYYGRKFWKKGSRVSPCPSSNNKAPLTWKVASAILRHGLTEDEGKSFTIADMNALIGKQLRVGVMVTPPKDGKQYNNVDSFLMTKATLPAFDESKVKKDEPAKAPAPLTPAEIVAKASGGKFVPHGTEHAEDVEFGETEPDDLPFA